MIIMLSRFSSLLDEIFNKLYLKTLTWCQAIICFHRQKVEIGRDELVIEYPAQTDPHERIQQLIQEYREDPGSSIILRELGRTYREISQLDTAQFYLEQALAVNRQDWEALAILGSIHADKEDYETALLDRGWY